MFGTKLNTYLIKWVKKHTVVLIWIYCISVLLSQTSNDMMIIYIASLWPNDSIGWLKSESTLAQVMDCCLMALTINWTNVDSSSRVFCGIHSRAISQEMLKKLTDTDLILTLKWHGDANLLSMWSTFVMKKYDIFLTCPIVKVSKDNANQFMPCCNWLKHMSLKN